MKLTDKQRIAVMQKCIAIAVKNGWKKSIVTLTCNYELLYDTSNGFAKALFGETRNAYWSEPPWIVDMKDNYKKHLALMVGQDPTVYLYNWLKEKGASK